MGDAMLQRMLGNLVDNALRAAWAAAGVVAMRRPTA